MPRCKGEIVEAQQNEVIQIFSLRSLYSMNFCKDGKEVPAHEAIRHAMKERLCVLTGKSPRGEFWHSVVGKIGHNDADNTVVYELVHDPYPAGHGIEGNPKAVGFLAKVL